MTGRPPSHAVRLRMGPLPIDVVTFAEALDRIETLVNAGRGGRVFTPNVDHVVLADRDPALRAAYARADLSLVDGAPLVLLSRLSAAKLPERIAGSDLFEPLLARAAERRWPVLFLGGGPGVGELAARRMTSRYPELVVAGTLSPEVRVGATAVELAPIVDAVRAAKPALVFVALGAPKQELFIDAIASAVAPAVLLGVGAALDFAAGRVKRAPRVVSRLGLEWLYRLVREPRRLASRYLVRDAGFPWALARHGGMTVEVVAETRSRAPEVP